MPLLLLLWNLLTYNLSFCNGLTGLTRVLHHIYTQQSVKPIFLGLVFLCVGGWSHISTSKRTVLWSFLRLFHPEPNTSWDADDHFRRTETNISHQLICAFLLIRKAVTSLSKQESSPCVYYRRVLFLLSWSLSILQHLSCTLIAGFHRFSAGVSIKIGFSVSPNSNRFNPLLQWEKMPVVTVNNDGEAVSSIR